MQDSNAGATLGVGALVVEDPGEDVGDCGEDAGCGEEDGKVAHASGLDGCEDDVASTAHEREEDNHEATLLGSVGDVGGENTEEEGEEVWRCSETLRVDVAVTHTGKDCREKYGQGSEGDVAGKVHELQGQLDFQKI